MTEVQRPETRADLEALPYGDKQALAADLGFGRIVGVKEKKLENYIDDQLFDEPVDDVVDEDERSNSTPQPDSDSATERETTRMDDSDTESDSSEQQTDAIEVGHEGKEKLSPEGAPDDGGTAVEPPEGLEGIADAKPSDLEAGADLDVDDAGASETASDPAPADQRETSGDAGKPEKEDSSGLLSRIKGDSESERTSEEIVEDAPTEEERERRRAMKAQLDQTMAGGGQGASDQDAGADDSGDPASSESSSATTSSTKKASGMLVDESVVGHMIEMPFNAASAATGWDGWELTPQERQANAELFIAMCDEHDVDVGPTTMFALSIGGTFGGKAMRYKRRDQSEQTSAGLEERADQDDVVDDVQDDRGDRADQGGAAPPQQTSAGAVDGGQESSTADDGVDFEDSSTW